MNKSLGALLAICLAGLQFLAVLAVVSSSFVTSERALIQHARDLLRDVAINAGEHSKGFLSPAEGAAELAARLAQNRVVASDDPVLLERLLFQQLRVAPQFAGLYFGGGDGQFVYVMRSPDGPGPFRSKIITTTDGVRSVQLIWRDAEFNAIESRLDPDDPYDPRDRPWYLQAMAERTTIWTDPYIFFSSQQPGITLASPVLNDDGSVRGAVGVDIEISMISHFLSRLNIGETGKALIVHRNGDVIAHPDLELIKTTDADGTLRFASIREIDDPIARAAFGGLMTDDGITVTEETPSQFVVAKARYVSTVLPMLSAKQPWTIAVYAPENDFTALIKQNRIQNIWIAAAVAVVTGIVGLMLAGYIHRPVQGFADRSALIAQGGVDPMKPAPRTYRELERANDTLVQEMVARREAEREYGQTFDLAPRGMAQISPHSGRFTRVNARLCEITGFSPAEMMGMSLPDLVHPDEKSNCPLAESARDGMGANHEIRCTRKDGGTIWVAINTIMIRDHAGHPLHAVVTMDDITASKDSEGQIQRLSRDMSHLARGNTMGQMASGLAHELNQPLTAIAQNADAALLVLDQHSGETPELREILTEIEHQSLRAGEIIRALRGFIRKDEGATSVFDLGELVEQTLRLVRPEATEAGVIVETGLPEGLPPVEANRVQIAQVIVNLLRNAIEAMARDGDNLRRVTLRAARAGNYLEVEVHDTGPGVAPGVTLFAEFETTKPGGMGLGLSICRTIVEQNGGSLWHETPAGRGAVFRFTLPLRRET